MKNKSDIIALWISSLDEAEILYEYLDEERFLKVCNILIIVYKQFVIKGGSPIKIYNAKRRF